MERHYYTKKEDRVIRQCISENIGNIRDGIRKAALSLGLKYENVHHHYYHIIKPEMQSWSSLKKLIMSRGFFMLSKKNIYIQGKNSKRAKVQPLWLNEGTAEKLVNIKSHGKNK